MVAVGLLGVGGTLGPAHGKKRDADRGYVREIVDGVVEQRDGVAEDAADDFGGDEAERGGHGPAKHRRASVADARGRVRRGCDHAGGCARPKPCE